MIACYALLTLLTAVNFFVALPLQFNCTAFSLLIIIAGSYRSVDEMLANFKAVHVSKTESKVEVVSKSEAMQFPFYAGGMLCTLYGLIKYFGKEIVNPLLLGYMGIGASQVIKEALLDMGIGRKLDERKLLKLKIDTLGLDL